MSEKPLHVRVAEALGCKPEPPSKDTTGWGCGAFHHHPAPIQARHWRVERYDKDWRATGPLIEHFRIDVNYFPHEGSREPWGASIAGSVPDEPYGYGETPLIAVCDLILALHSAGKLPK